MFHTISTLEKMRFLDGDNLQNGLFYLYALNTIVYSKTHLCQVRTNLCNTSLLINTHVTIKQAPAGRLLKFQSDSFLD